MNIHIEKKSERSATENTLRCCSVQCYNLCSLPSFLWMPAIDNVHVFFCVSHSLSLSLVRFLLAMRSVHRIYLLYDLRDMQPPVVHNEMRQLEIMSFCRIFHNFFSLYHRNEYHDKNWHDTITGSVAYTHTHHKKKTLNGIKKVGKKIRWSVAKI